MKQAAWWNVPHVLRTQRDMATVRNAVPSLLPRADGRVRFGEYFTPPSQSEWRWVRRDLLLLKAKKAECNLVRAQRLQVVMIFFSPLEWFRWFSWKSSVQENWITMCQFNLLAPQPLPNRYLDQLIIRFADLCLSPSLEFASLFWRRAPELLGRNRGKPRVLSLHGLRSIS